MLFQPIRWEKNSIVFIDQTELPMQLKYIRCRDIDTLCEAIKSLRIRGAPLIGVSVALGYVLCVINSKAKTLISLKRELKTASQKLRKTRPTAVNLFWALERMERHLSFLRKQESKRAFMDSRSPFAKATADRFRGNDKTIMESIKNSILHEALSILNEDRAMCRAIGKNGAKLIEHNDVILTHCNAGMLATAGYGTALSILYEAKRQGKRFKVYVDETRPLMQGSRLTMWELMKNGIDATLICDDMAASTIKNIGVTKLIVGADRIARNGDTANKIGTYGLAVLAKYHKIPFYVAAPSSTIDRNIRTGEDIPIEERKREELIYLGAKQTAPSRANVYNPAFDVTPHKLITAIITERGTYSIEKFRKLG